MLGLIGKLFGTKGDREIKRIAPVVDEINAIYEELAGLSDDDLRHKTVEFRERLAAGETLDDILPEAFAVVKDACRRLCGQSFDVVGHPLAWEMVPYDVQLHGGVCLHEGKIAEMATGEGKTLVATLPLYLNALEGKGVHLVTVNDYLALRDSQWMGQIFRFLGLTVGCIQHDQAPHVRRQQYECDITYGTNNEFGFDYLRDNMARDLDSRVQRGHHYAIVDEVDSVLIDEARTPLIISGPVERETNTFEVMKPAVDKLVREQMRLVNAVLAEAEKDSGADAETDDYELGIKLLKVKRGAPKNKRFSKLMTDGRLKKLVMRVENDYIRDKRMSELDDEMFYSIDEKGHNVEVSEKGRDFFERDFFLLPDLSEEVARIDADESLSVEDRVAKREEIHQLYARRTERIHQVLQLLKAYALFEKDVEYVVQDGKVVIVDEFTGRLMSGRRYSDGLHSAIEAKEGLVVEGDTQTMATITLQNYFRLYKKLAGMTGTAETEAGEFWNIYKLDVSVIPTNQPVRRQDYNDVIFRTKREKYNAIIEEIETMHKAGRPVLVGTVSVEVSETLSRLLKRTGIPHKVLNAKFHAQEAEIVSRAGIAGAVTIATNMAGRGTDIKLGPGVVKGAKCRLVDDNGSCDAFDKKSCYENTPCGLHIIGTERHESRRIDRQLRGRSGRQGDPGSTRFFLSLEDDLMRLFGSDRIAGIMTKLGVQEGEAIEHSMVTGAIERAQKRVEQYNFDIRKHLLEYDDVMNQQREVIYDLRLHALEGADLSQDMRTYIREVVEKHVDATIDPSEPVEDWNVKGLAAELSTVVVQPVQAPERAGNVDALTEEFTAQLMRYYEAREEELTPDVMREVERRLLIAIIDDKWKDHLYEIDQLKTGVGLVGYGQKDPLLEYKKGAFAMFTELLVDVKSELVKNLFRVRVERPIPAAAPPRQLQELKPEMASRPAAPAPAPRMPVPRGGQVVEEAVSLAAGAAVPPPVAPVAPEAASPAAAAKIVAPALARSAPRSGAFSATHAALSGFAAANAGAGAAAGAQAEAPAAPVVRNEPKVGRNDPCYCGSGKKFKKCHGATQ